MRPSVRIFGFNIELIENKQKFEIQSTQCEESEECENHFAWFRNNKFFVIVALSTELFTTFLKPEIRVYICTTSVCVGGRGGRGACIFIVNTMHCHAGEIQTRAKHVTPRQLAFRVAC